MEYKFTKLVLLSICFIFANCDVKTDEVLVNSQLFVYQQGLCCQNLLSLSEISLPYNCKPDYTLFYAINLEDFDLAQNYNFGDTLSLSYEFTSDCEAQGDAYDCIVNCDLRHGVPIRILSLN